MSGIVSMASERVRIDARALAAFRISAGFVILLDLFLRAAHVTAFYTDRGVLPRWLLAELFPKLHSVSVHAIYGSTSAQVVLFVIAGVAALALLVGYRTTLATTLSTYLLVSLQFRNPLILSAGDLLLSALLFFGIFLPLGARCSVDAVHSDRKQQTVSSIRSVAPLVFIAVLIYSTNALAHLQSDAWVSGQATKLVFSVDSVTVLLGDLIASHPVVLETINWVWLGMLATAPLLILTTGRTRSLLSGVFLTAHLGILLTLSIITFPLANCLGLLLFFPSSAWDRAPTWKPAWVERHAQAVTDKLYQWGGSLPPERAITLARYLGSAVVAVVLVVMIVWATVSLSSLQSPSDKAAVLSEREQYPFIVFAPEPLHTDGWYVAPATLESGLVIDAYRLTSVSWDRPPDLDRAYPGPRWTTYMIAGRFRVHAARGRVVDGFARYLCDRAADHYAPAVENVTVYFIEDHPGGAATTRRRLTQRTCR
jgi:hypothetical protein